MKFEDEHREEGIPDIFLDADGFPFPATISSSDKIADCTWGEKGPAPSDDDSLWGAHQDDFSVSIYQNATIFQNAIPQTKSMPIGRIEIVTEPMGTRKIAATMTPKWNTQTPIGRTTVPTLQRIGLQSEGNLLSVPFSSPTEKRQPSQPPPDEIWEASENPCSRRAGSYHHNRSRSSHDLFSADNDYVEFLKSGGPESPDGIFSKFNKSFGDFPSSLDDIRSLTSADSFTPLPKKKNRSRSKPKLAMEVQTMVGSMRSGGPTLSRPDKSAPRRDRSMDGERKSRRDRSRDEDLVVRRHPSVSAESSSANKRSADALDTGTTQRDVSIPAENSRSGDNTGTKSSRSTRGERITDRKSRRERSYDKTSRRSTSTGPLSESTFSRRGRDRSSTRDRSAEPPFLVRPSSKSRTPSVPPSRSTNGKNESWQSAVSERRVAPQRSKSDDGCDRFHASIQDLEALGVAVNLERHDSSLIQYTSQRSVPTRKGPARAQSMNDHGNHRLRLQESLGLVDRIESSTTRNRRKRDEKSTGNGSLSSRKSAEYASSGRKSRFKRLSDPGLDYALQAMDSASSLQKRQPDEKSIFSGSTLSDHSNEEMFRGRKDDFLERTTSNYSGGSTDGGSSNDRRKKDELKLAREKRKAEEAKLRRLQEESRLLEAKRQADEVRLKTLQAESKLLEAKRMEEETRLRFEASTAKEQRKGEETKLAKKLEDGRRQRIEEEEVPRIGLLCEEAKLAKTDQDQPKVHDRNHLEESVQNDIGGSEESSVLESVQISGSAACKIPCTMDNKVDDVTTDVDNHTRDPSGEVGLTTTNGSETVAFKDDASQNPSVDGEEKYVYLPEVRPLVGRTKSVSERIARLTPSGSTQGPQLPPAFQLVHDQAKRLQKK